MALVCSACGMRIDDPKDTMHKDCLVWKYSDPPAWVCGVLVLAVVILWMVVMFSGWL